MQLKIKIHKDVKYVNLLTRFNKIFLMVHFSFQIPFRKILNLQKRKKHCNMYVMALFIFSFGKKKGELCCKAL